MDLFLPPFTLTVRKREKLTCVSSDPGMGLLLKTWSRAHPRTKTHMSQTRDEFKERAVVISSCVSRSCNAPQGGG